MTQTSDSAASRPAQVRLALPSEGEAIAALQRRCWDHDQPDGLRQWLLDNLDLATVAEGWRDAVVRPPDARCRVFVALTGTEETTEDQSPGGTGSGGTGSGDGGAIVGFVTTQPAADPDADDAADGEIAEWLVDPVARGQGHGSRLLNAAVDTLRADGFSRATTWVVASDDGRRRVLVESGWDADGAHRTIGPDEALGVKQVRLHTAIDAEED